jgi:hypothetical protein
MANLIVFIPAHSDVFRGILQNNDHDLRMQSAINPRYPPLPATFADWEGIAYGRIDWMDGVASEHGRDRLLNLRDPAAYLTDLGLEMAAQTLARKFCEGNGPLCTRVGDRAMFWRHHLDDYFQKHLSAPRQSSSEPRVPPFRLEQACNERPEIEHSLPPPQRSPNSNQATKCTQRPPQCRYRFRPHALAFHLLPASGVISVA